MSYQLQRLWRGAWWEVNTYDTLDEATDEGDSCHAIQPENHLRVVEVIDGE